MHHHTRHVAGLRFFRGQYDMSIETLAAALLADRQRDTSTRHNIIPCRTCGYTFVYKGRRGDLNGNFCSLHCQSWYDAGNPPIEHDQPEKAYKAPIEGWRVVAGPADVEVSAPYYASVFPRSQLYLDDHDRKGLPHTLRVLPQRVREPWLTMLLGGVRTQLPRTRSQRGRHGRGRY